jgi:hypothetical protein
MRHSTKKLSRRCLSQDWSKLSDFEKEDTTSGGRELACSAGACEIVDLTAALTAA